MGLVLISGTNKISVKKLWKTMKVIRLSVAGKT
jgi:hypothetical protein